MARLNAQPAENVNAAACAQILETIPAGPVREEIAKALAAILEQNSQWPTGEKTRLHGPISEIFDDAAFLHSLAASATDANALDPLTQDWQWIRPPMTALLKLAREFGSAFAQAKRIQGAVDFHDLEQFALRLLWDIPACGPTAGR